MWLVSPLRVMFHSKSSICSFTNCMIFGPLIFFRHDVTKTQILSKVSLCNFHNANHYKSNWNDKKQVNWSHLNINFIEWWFFGSLDHFPISQHNENTDIEYGNGMIKHQWTHDLGYHLSNYFSLLKVFFACCLSDFKQTGVHFWPNLEAF